jgi:DNA anti-recombination protein RmuC
VIFSAFFEAGTILAENKNPTIMIFKRFLLALMLISVTPVHSQALHRLSNPVVTATGQLSRVPNAAEKEMLAKALDEYKKINNILIQKLYEVTNNSSTTTEQKRQQIKPLKSEKKALNNQYFSIIKPFMNPTKYERFVKFLDSVTEVQYLCRDSGSNACAK